MGFRNGWPMSNFMFALWDIDSWLPLSFACFVCYACFAWWGITAWLPQTFACFAWWDITAWLPLSFAWLLPVLSMAATIVCHPVVWGEGEGTIHHSTTLLFNYFSLKAFWIFETTSPSLGLVLGKYTSPRILRFPLPLGNLQGLRDAFSNPIHPSSRQCTDTIHLVKLHSF